MHVIGVQKKTSGIHFLGVDSSRNHSQTEREAIVFAAAKLHQYLCGRPFTLVTDNRSLRKMLGHNHARGAHTGSLEAQMQQWVLILSAYSYKIEYNLGDRTIVLIGYRNCLWSPSMGDGWS